MTRKTLWIIGGAVIVVIGGAAYLSNSWPPAGKDASGTIVAADRARADSPTPPASADQTAAPAADTSASDAAAAAAAEAAKGSADTSAPAAADATR